MPASARQGSPLASTAHILLVRSNVRQHGGAVARRESRIAGCVVEELQAILPGRNRSIGQHEFEVRGRPNRPGYRWMRAVAGMTMTRPLDAKSRTSAGSMRPASIAARIWRALADRRDVGRRLR